VARVDHLGVVARAQVGKVLEELLVAQVEEVALWIVEAWVHVLVELPVSLSELHVEVWTPLAGELAVEDKDVPLLRVLQAVLGRGRERGRGKEGREELVILSMLPVLRSSDVSSIILKLVPNIHYPEALHVVLVPAHDEVCQGAAVDAPQGGVLRTRGKCGQDVQPGAVWQDVLHLLLQLAGLHDAELVLRVTSDKGWFLPAGPSAGVVLLQADGSLTQAAPWGDPSLLTPLTPSPQLGRVRPLEPSLQLHQAVPGDWGVRVQTGGGGGAEHGEGTSEHGTG